MSRASRFPCITRWIHQSQSNSVPLGQPMIDLNHGLAVSPEPGNWADVHFPQPPDIRDVRQAQRTGRMSQFVVQG